MKKGKNRFTMGRLLISAGICVKVFQMCASLWSVGWAGGTVLSMISLCAVTGGLAVFAYERWSVTSIYALVGAVLLLLSTALESGTGIAAFFFKAAYIGVFVAYGIMLLSMRHKMRKLSGVAVLLLGIVIVLHVTGVLILPPAALICVLIVEYVIMATGLYL